MEDIKKGIVLQLQKIVKELTGQDNVPILEHPKDERHGDYSTNIAMVLFGEVSKGEKVSKVSNGSGTPMDLAQRIADKFKVQSFDFAQDRNSEFRVLEKVEAVKPGFINFYLSEKYLLENINTVLEQRDKFGSKKEDPNKKIVVEYSSPNIAKPFTVGHLRSTIIGDAVANLLHANGWKVFRDNHLGDWGTQFGKQIYAIKTWGNEERIEKSQNPVKELVALYVKFHNEAEKNPELEDRAREWFKKLEEGDSQARGLWKKCVEWSLKEFQKIYNQLGIRFTENNGVGYGESFFEDKMSGVIKELDEKRLLKENEGAKLVFFPKDPSTLRPIRQAQGRRAQGSGQAKSFGSAQDKYPPLMIIKKDGTTLYATRDLATDRFRLKNYGKDVLIINEVGIEQSLYFKQLFEVEKMLGWVKDGQRIHLKHGHYRFRDEKMSTRKGNVIWLEDILKMAIDQAHDLAMRVGVSEYERGSMIKELHIVGGKSKRDEITRQVAIGAIKWNDLKRTSNLDIIFDWDEILNMEGNSGPYLQYTFARTQSVLRKSEIRPFDSAQGKNPKHEMVRQAHHPEHSRRTNSNFQNTKVQNVSNFGHSNFNIASNFDIRTSNLELEPEEVLLLRAIHRFPEVVGEAAEKFAPNIICNYLFDLSQKFNLFYQKVPIIKGAKSLGSKVNNLGGSKPEFRLALTAAVGQVIKNGLYLLGIEAPERM